MDFVEAGIKRAAIYDGDTLEPGMSFTGPAIIEEPVPPSSFPPACPATWTTTAIADSDA